MKKLVILFFNLCLIIGVVQASPEFSQNIPQKPHAEDFARRCEQRKAHEKQFEQRLGLTDEQKIKAKDLRKIGFEKIKPIIDELNQKKQEVFNIKQSNMSNEAKERKLIVLDKDIKELQKKAAIVRKQNMKDFESILDKKQKNILKDMKKEGRANFDKERRKNPVENK